MPHLVGDLRNSSQGERTTKYGNRLALTVCLTLVASTCFAAPSFAQNLIPVVKPRALPYRNKAVLLHAWVTGLAILAVIGAWGWIAWQTVRTRCKPAASTLLVMAAATGLVVIAVLWPVIEPQLVRVLMM